jgi:3',5'-cyclic AMP phosphodiesterase CpdA
VIRIVHLSDFHFSKKNFDGSVWKIVANFVNDEIKPDLILITGDITDNGGSDEFTLASEKLSELKIRNFGDTEAASFYVVPGNHDLYTYKGVALRGRKFWPFGNAANSEEYDRKEQIFKSTFNGRCLPPDPACTATLCVENRSCRVRLIGIDSNHRTCLLAQGAIEESAINQAVKLATDDKKSDLVIALVHHHVLPIPSVERGKMQANGLANVINATGLLNAGVLLERLSSAQVNLILHGHEHASHVARFAGSEPQSGTVVIVGAGSTTGHRQAEGWNINRATFNVLELEENGSVCLQRAKYDGSGFAFVGRNEVLSARDVRRARAFRRSKAERSHQRQLPTTRLWKVFDIDENRSVTISESRTDVYTEERLWSLSTTNASGFVEGDAELSFELHGGHNLTKKAAFSQDENDHNTYCMNVEVGPATEPSLTFVKRYSAVWRWCGAAVLRESDFHLLPQISLEGPRKFRREFVVLRIDDGHELEHANLTLILPPPHSPENSEFVVEFKKHGSETRKFSAELTKSLEFARKGYVNLQIPFPLPGYSYYLSWRPLGCATSNFSETAKKLVTEVKACADQLRDLALDAVSAPDGHLRVGIYGLAEISGSDFIPSISRLTSSTDSPESLTLGARRSFVRAALLGNEQVLWPPPAEGLETGLHDETMLLYSPLWLGSTQEDACAIILLRVAILEPAGWDNLDDENALKKIDQLMGKIDIARSVIQSNFRTS